MTTLEKLEELVYHGFQEAAQRNQETARSLQETERLLKENAIKAEAESAKLKKQLDGLTKSLGLFAESTVYPSTARLFNERGIELTGISSRVSERRNGREMEIDVLGAGPQAVVAIEVKLRLELEYIKKFLTRLPHFFEFFPRYRGLQLYGAVAGMSVAEEVARHAYKNGLFVLVQSGDNMKILNDEKFKPHAFNEPVNGAARRKK